LRQSDKSPVTRGVDKKGIEGSSLLKMSVLQDMKQKNIGSPIIPNKGVGSTLGYKVKPSENSNPMAVERYEEEKE